MEIKERGNWSSQFGFIAAAAGSAVGLGNIWRFPYITGLYGGAAFVLVYLLFVVLVGFITSPVTPIIWHAIFMIMCIGVVSAGIEKGIEKYSKILMPALVVILFCLIVRALTLPGAGAGVSFYLKPDFGKLSAEGILAALGQAFFSLSLGMGCMITYGSYLKKDQAIPANSYWIAGTDTAIALLAGLAIFPAVFAFGLEPGTGPALTFITVPAVFASMGAIGHLFGILFFFLLTIAALTSAISLLEVVCAYFIDEKKWNRKKAVWIMGFVIFLLGVPSSLGQGVWSSYKFIGGRDFLDSLDFIASNVLLPLGGFLLCIFIGWYWGTGKAIEEGNIGAKGGITLGGGYRFLIKYVAPVAIFIVFLKSIGVF